MNDPGLRALSRQLDRDADARHGLNRDFPDDYYPSHEPSAFWTAMEGKTECPECHGPLSVSRDCPKGCLDDLQDELTGVGGDPLPMTGRNHKGWLRKTT